MLVKATDVIGCGDDKGLLIMGGESNVIGGPVRSDCNNSLSAGYAQLVLCYRLLVPCRGNYRLVLY